MKKDFSKEIFEKYYNSKEKILQITLKDGTILEGILVSFIHGEGGIDPLIIKWHFVDKADIEKHHLSIDGEEIGTLINQEDIKSVNFKE